MIRQIGETSPFDDRIRWGRCLPSRFLHSIYQAVLLRFVPDLEGILSRLERLAFEPNMLNVRVEAVDRLHPGALYWIALLYLLSPYFIQTTMIIGTYQDNNNRNQMWVLWNQKARFKRKPCASDSRERSRNRNTPPGKSFLPTKLCRPQ